MTQVLKKQSNEAIHKARAIQRVRKFTANPIQKDPAISDILNDIPYFTAMIRRLNDIGIATERLGTMIGGSSPEMLQATNNLPFVNLATRALDFIQIPFFYLMYFLMGKKAPITLKNNLKWLYAAVVFGLLLTAVTAPITAPFIAVIIAFTILAVTTFTLGQLLQQYRVNKSLLAELITSIDTEMNKLHLIQQHARELENSLLETTTDIAAIDIISKIEQLNLQYTTQSTLIQTLYDKKQECEEKQKIESSVMNKCLTMLIYTLTTIGAIIAFFLPPVGLAIMITAGFINAAYALFQITVYLSTKVRADEVIEQKETPDLHESTSDILSQIENSDTQSEPIPTNDETNLKLDENIPETHPDEEREEVTTHEEQPPEPRSSSLGG